MGKRLNINCNSQPIYVHVCYKPIHAKKSKKCQITTGFGQNCRLKFTEVMKLDCVLIINLLCNVNI